MDHVLRTSSEEMINQLDLFTEGNLIDNVDLWIKKRLHFSVHLMMD